MKPTTLALVAGLGGGVAAGAAVLLLMKPGETRDQDAIAVEQTKVLAARLDGAEEDNAKLRGDIERLRRDLGALALRPAPKGPTEVMTAGTTEKPKATAAGTTAGTPAEDAPEDAAPVTLANALAELQNRELDFMSRETLWQKIREAKLTDQVVAELEKLAKADPKNPTAQVDLGNAYLKKLSEVPPGPMQGIWGNKADRAFDAALESDPEHWEARFTKAVSLSFWPPNLGKQGEAIKHFETLVSQQEGRAPKSDFAQTYMFLGNMYQQIGKSDKALETWRKGAALFPENASLKKQILMAGN
jgi:tetratricopeptide (TPR) repeat protein